MTVAGQQKREVKLIWLVERTVKLPTEALVDDPPGGSHMAVAGLPRLA